MSISAKELANKIKVSPATISMVFNQKPGISDATRKMVIEAAKEYGYLPPKKAAQTKSQIQLVIYQKHGKVASDTPFFSEVTKGITQEFLRRNCTVNISYFMENGDQKSQIRALKESGCAGMILFATEMEEADFRIFQNISIPMVVLDCYYDTLDYDCVLINNIQGAFKATDYLIRCGHKHVGYLHSSIDISNFRERADGYYKALRTHGLDTSHPFVHRISPTSQEGYQDMIRILEEKPALADAYFADNDIIAAAAMRAFQQFGYRIPEDISIIGFDDLPLCDLMHPPLSTMRVDQQELGMLAAGRLYEIMEKNDLQKLKISITASMVCRESVQK